MLPTWYLGMVFCVLAVFGLFVMIRRATVAAEHTLLVFLLAFTPVALLYLYNPAITPDHIWASRRLLPVILPGIGVLTAYLMTKIEPRGYRNYLLYSTAAVVFMVGTISTSGFFLKESTNKLQLTQINRFCDELPEDSAVLLVGIMGLVATQTVHSYCNVPTVRYVGSPTQAEYIDFYNNAQQNGKVPIAAAFVNDKGLFVEDSFIRNLPVTEYKTVEKVFEAAPNTMVYTEKEIVYGQITQSGTLKLAE